MIVPTAVGRPIAGYSWIVLSAIGTGFLSFGLWVHHMYTTGLPSVSLGFFSAASESVAIPTGIQIFALIATVLLGRVQRSVPMLFSLGALATFVVGGLTGVMIAVAPFDFQVHDTYFIVAHLHYTLIGGMLFPVLAGVCYFFPFVTGKQLSRRMGIWSFWLAFLGFNASFLPMHLTGLLGMPRRVFTYGAERGWGWLNLWSSVAAFVLAAGIALFVIDCIRSALSGPPAGRNPWRAGTLEWLVGLPGPTYGLRAAPHVESRYPLWDDPDLAARTDRGEGYLADAPELLRETLVTSVLDARPLQVLRVQGPSWLPAVTAVGLGGVFIFATFKMWLVVAGFAVVFFAGLFTWLWTGTAIIPEKPEKDIGNGKHVPLYVSGPASTGWWAMFITMTGDLTAFLSLIFGYFFFWTIHPDFPPEGVAGPGWHWPLAAALLAVGSWAATLAARFANGSAHLRLCQGLLAAAVVLALASSAALLAGPWMTGLQPTSHSYPAIVWALAVWTALHLGAGALMQSYVLARSIWRKMTPQYDADIRNVMLYWHFSLFGALVTAATIGGFPLVS